MRTIEELHAWVMEMPPGEKTYAALGLIERMPKPYEFRLAAVLLEMARAEFSNHGCNDWEWPDWFPIAERESFVRAMEAWNGTNSSEVEEIVQNTARAKYGPVDWYLMAYLANRFAQVERS
jgi:hypothetical protein